MRACTHADGWQTDGYACMCGHACGLSAIHPPVWSTHLNQDMVCSMMCVSALVAGFQLAGVEFSHECWCGQSYNQALRLSEQNCNSPCPADPGQTCGGFNAMKIYHTGLGGEVVCWSGMPDSEV